MATFGAFGKMPGLGDFFHFDLKRAFIDAWDRWLGERLAASRAALGADWQPRYFSAPIWRFSLTPGLAGPEGMLGVLMPSVDRVGRHFPLTIAGAFPAGKSALQMHFAGRQTFEKLEELALGALDARVGIERLRSELASVRLPPIPGRISVCERGGRLTVVCDDEVAGCLAAERSATGRRAPSAWSCLGQNDRRLMIVDGLPGSDEALGLFDLAAPVWAAPTESAA